MNINNDLEFLDKVFLRLPFYSTTDYDTSKLAELLASNTFRNALWLAAPEFYKELEKKSFELDALTSKERLTVLKFYNRMSFRATPFGAFAAFSLVPWSPAEKTSQITSKESLLHLLPAIRWEKSIRSNDFMELNILIAVNPTLYRLGDDWRYTRYEEEKTGKLSFFAYGLEYNEADAAVLEFLKKKPVSLKILSDFLIEITGCVISEASLHIDKLLEEQVLICTKEIPLLLKENTIPEMARFRSFNYDANLQLEKELRHLYSDLTEDFDGKCLYAGLEQSIHDGDICAEWQEVLRRAVDALFVLSPSQQDGPLQQFRQAFEQKFGNRMVPLLEALDPDIGLTYDGLRQSDEHELLRGLEFQGEHRRTDRLVWTPVHRLLMKHWTQNADRGRYDPVCLTIDDIQLLTSEEVAMPPSISLLFSLCNENLILHGVGGVTATSMTGRFSAFSSAFWSLCQTTSKIEAQNNPDVCFAELVQVSHINVDNVNRRRQVYDQAIPLNAFPQDTDLLPAELGLLISGKELVLVHQSTGKRIIPRLPTAFNYYHNDMPLFRFLCDLQHQSIKSNLNFDPEKLFPGLDFYPRVAFNTVILSLARWHLRKEEIAALTQRPFSISNLRLFCNERGIPSLIAAGRGDQQLVFNLSNDDEAIFFLESLHDTANSVITEQLLPKDYQLKGRASYSAQYVATIINKKRVYFPLDENQLISDKSVVRDFPPGTEWIYVKIYCTPQSADYILLDVLLPWIIQNSSTIISWFFVRFHDPDSHLRVRVLVPLPEVGSIQSDLQSLLTSIDVIRLVQRVYFDTYQREIERYTPTFIAQIESIFHLGSETVANVLIEHRNNADGEHLLWPILHCYGMLNVFLADRENEFVPLCEQMADLFFREHGGEKKLKVSMDKRFRELRPAFEEAIKSQLPDQILNERLSTAISELSDACNGLEGAVRRKLIADIVHMQVNRIFITDQRRFETFIWHCIGKLARSKAAPRTSIFTENYAER